MNESNSKRAEDLIRKIAEETRDGMVNILWTIGAVVVVMAVLSLVCGCAYRGGKVIDGTNLAIGMTIPGTEWRINALDYVGGIRVAGQDSTHITVTNDVFEINSYFGVVTTTRNSRMSATIEPTGKGFSGEVERNNP